MSDNRPVTGGDLYKLWRVADIALPTVRTAYVEQLKEIHPMTSADEQKFGRCHSWWAWVATDLELALFNTEGALAAGEGALNTAIRAYQYADGANAGELTKAGQKLDEIFNDPNRHNKNDELTEHERPGSVEVPNHNPPADWTSFAPCRRSVK